MQPLETDLYGLEQFYTPFFNLCHTHTNTKADLSSLFQLLAFHSGIFKKIFHVSLGLKFANIRWPAGHIFLRTDPDSVGCGTRVSRIRVME